MTKADFKDNFDGKKIIFPYQFDHKWVIPAIFGANQWCGLDDGGELYKGSYISGYDLYKKPKLEFGFEYNGMWAKDKIGTSPIVYYFSKINNLLWGMIGSLGYGGDIYTKQRIVRHYQPTTKPDNHLGYGIE